jgi:hypothetical protein
LQNLTFFPLVNFFFIKISEEKTTEVPVEKIVPSTPVPEISSYSPICEFSIRNTKQLIQHI